MTLSLVMQVALEKLDEHESLIRLTGGFWTWPLCSVTHHAPTGMDPYDVPDWYVGVQTVDALIARNLVQVSAYNERGYACMVTRKTAPS